MKCPVDNETLVMADRNGVEIDYCPKCRGVWLDRGELDKIIDRAAEAAPAAPIPAPQAQHRTAPPPPPPAYGQQPGHSPQSWRSDDDNDDEYYRRTGQHKKRKSFLGQMFDF
ncbi:MAG: zf-TFIIB domain-containing protein [Fuscovulum sp.]|nr:MAG: zf-TFIIB domain-containing protein [Fuscovulum sp.]